MSLQKTSTDKISWIHYIDAPNPYSSNVLLHKLGQRMVFDGYFLMEDGAMPVERIMILNGELYHIRILYKQHVNNRTPYFRPITPEPQVPMAEPQVPMAEPQVPMAEPQVPMAEPQVPLQDQTSHVMQKMNEMAVNESYDQPIEDCQTSIIEMEYEIIQKIDANAQCLLADIVQRIDQQKENEDQREEEAKKERLEQEEEERIYEAIIYRNSY
jgi:hypothetical protein